MSEECFNQGCGAQKNLSVGRNTSVNGDKVWTSSRDWTIRIIERKNWSGDKDAKNYKKKKKLKKCI